MEGKSFKEFYSLSIFRAVRIRVASWSRNQL